MIEREKRSVYLMIPSSDCGIVSIAEWMDGNSADEGASKQQPGTQSLRMEGIICIRCGEQKGMTWLTLYIIRLS